MDYLWTPWRYQYISNAGEPSAGDTAACIFCAAAANPGEDRQRLVIHRAAHCFVVLNRFPYTNGHIMIVPYAHVDSLAALAEPAALEIMRLAQRMETVLRAAYRPEGLNVGINMGKCAGAGIAGHVHLHMLPRWMGDANFMTTTGETRVLPETLDTTWEKLSAAFR